MVSMAAVAAAWWQGRGVGQLLDEHALESVRSIQQFAEGSRRRELALKSEILATNPGFVGYVSQALAAGAEPGGSVDAASIRDLLEERRSQYGFDVAAVLDPQGAVVVMLGDALRTRQDFSTLPLMLKVRAGAPAQTDLLMHDGRLVLLTLSPMVRGATIEALLLTGVEIGDAFVAEIGRAAQVDAALVAPTRDGFVVLASTLGVADQPTLAAVVGAEPPIAAGAAPEDSVREFGLALVDGQTRGVGYAAVRRTVNRAAGRHRADGAARGQHDRDPNAHADCRCCLAGRPVWFLAVDSPRPRAAADACGRDVRSGPARRHPGRGGTSARATSR